MQTSLQNQNMIKFLAVMVFDFFCILVGVSKIHRTIIMSNIIIWSFANYQNIGIALEIIFQIAEGLVVFIRNRSGLNEQLLGTVGPKIEEMEYEKYEYNYFFTIIGGVEKMVEKVYRWKDHDR